MKNSQNPIQKQTKKKKKKWGLTSKTGSGKRMTRTAIHDRLRGLPWGLSYKEPACNAGDEGSIPGSARSQEKEMAIHSSIPVWEISRTEEPVVYSPRGCKSRTWLTKPPPPWRQKGNTENFYTGEGDLRSQTGVCCLKINLSSLHSYCLTFPTRNNFLLRHNHFGNLLHLQILLRANQKTLVIHFHFSVSWMTKLPSG